MQRGALVLSFGTAREALTFGCPGLISDRNGQHLHKETNVQTNCD